MKTNTQTESIQSKYVVIKNCQYLTQILHEFIYGKRIGSSEIKYVFESDLLSLTYLFDHIDDAKLAAEQNFGKVMKVSMSLVVVEEVK